MRASKKGIRTFSASMSYITPHAGDLREEPTTYAMLRWQLVNLERG